MSFIILTLSVSLIYSTILTATYAQPHPAGGAAFVSVHDRLYVQGGDLGGGNLVSQFYSLDLSRSWQTNSPAWNSLPSGPINAYHSGGFSADMNSFVTFGRETSSPYTTANFINIFSTSTGSWIGTGSTMVADTTRRDMAIASDPAPGGQIYFMGGDAGTGGNSHSNSMDIYNLKSSVVSETNVPLPGPQNLQGGAATWLPNRNSMLIIGGLSDNTDSSVAYLYTPNTGSLSNPATSASYLTSPASLQSRSTPPSVPNTNYNPNPNTNTNTNTNTKATTNGGYVNTQNINNNNGYVQGGSSSSESSRSDSNGWSAQSTNGFFPSSRTAHCVASNEDGSIVGVFGGFVNRSSISDHSIYFLDTRTWSWTVSTSNSIRGRSYSACAFTGDQFVVWGGFYQNPTSTPNNLPSVEDSTIVYSLRQQNWVNTFVPSAASYGANINQSGDNRSVNGASNGDLSTPSGSKSFGVILAVAAAGAILALLITLGAIMVIRKRNQRRRNNNGGGGSRRASTSTQSQMSPGTSNSNSTLSTTKRTLIGAWDQKTLNNLENGLLAGAAGGEVANGTVIRTNGKEEYSQSMTTDEIPPVSAYNNWERRGSQTGEVTSKTTMTNSLMGITQTTIVATPPISKAISSNKMSWAAPAYQDPSNPQQPQPPSLEHAFGEKSRGAHYPISVEREYR